MSKKSKNIIYLICFILVLVFAYRIYQAKFNQENSEQILNTVSLLNLKEYQKNKSYIYATGKIESLEQVDIKSELSAKVTKINFQIGDEIKKGDVILELDNTILGAQLSQAQAGLNKLIAGASDEDIKIYESTVNLAKADLEKTEDDLNASIDSYEIALKLANNNLMLNSNNDSQIINNVYDNAKIVLQSINSTIENSVYLSDQILGINEKNSNDNYEKLLGVKDTGLLGNAKISFYQVEKEKDSYLSNLKIIDQMNQSDLKVFSDKTIILLNNIYKNLNDISELLKSTVTSADFNQTDLNNLKNSVNTNKAAISSAQSNLTAIIQGFNSSETSFDSYELAYNKAQQDLDNAKISAANTLKIKQASYEQALASLDKIKANPRNTDLATLQAIVSQSSATYEKSIVRAPFSGTISSMPFKVGDLVISGQIVSGVVNQGGIQIKTYVNPQERTLINIGSSVIIENDYEGLVTNIAPSIDSSSKKIEIIIALNDEYSDKLTIGQYANVKILGTNNNNYFILPIAAVKVYSDRNTIFIINENNKIEEKEIEIGEILGDNIEIKSGLNINDKIISSIAGLSIDEEVIIK